MISKTKTLLAAIAAICHSGSVFAGGSDITLMPTETLFEKGNYASVSTVNVTPDVTGSTIAPSGSMYGSYRASTFSLKMGLYLKFLLLMQIICQPVYTWITELLGQLAMRMLIFL